MAVEFGNDWEVCEPARFAVELYDVLDGKADKIYINPRLFPPHLAENMRHLLRVTLRRLSGKGMSARPRLKYRVPRKKNIKSCSSRSYRERDYDLTRINMRRVRRILQYTWWRSWK